VDLSVETFTFVLCSPECSLDKFGKAQSPHHPLEGATWDREDFLPRNLGARFLFSGREL
jgi:hypothetical protein